MAYFRCGGNEKHYATISVTTDYLFGETVTCACADVGYSQTTTFSDDGEANFTVNDWGRYTITSGDHASIIDVSAWYVTYDVDFAGSMELNLTLEGAMNDTITIKDSTGATVGTCIFNNSTTGQTRITTPLTGGEYTFVSSIANATDGSSSNYSKTATLTDETTSVKVMPDGALYWYGNECSSITGGWSLDGYTGVADDTLLTKNTNSFYADAVSTPTQHAGTNYSIDFSDYSLLKMCCISHISNNPGVQALGLTQKADWNNNRISFVNIKTGTDTTNKIFSSYPFDLSISDHGYIITGCFGDGRRGTIYAIWLE